MGARQSKRSVDITTTPKKDGLPTDSSVAGDAAAPGDGKLERIEETDNKPTTNGTGPHSDVADEKDKESKEHEKEEDKDEDTHKSQDNAKVEDGEQESHTEAPPTEAGEVTTPTEENTPTSPDGVASPDSSKDAKKKDKMKKKWSFRSLSFGKRDKSKTTREDAPKNGDVTKEEPLAEGGEEVEVAVSAEKSTVQEQTAVSSPAEEAEVPIAQEATKEEEKAVPVSPKPVEEKKEEPTPAPTPVPVEEKKEEIEKVEPVVADKVEVSPVQTIAPIDVSQPEPIATSSIIERKTSEELPPPLPSSPPPTPIDPSPSQRAQHAAANASALAEALKVPAEAAFLTSQSDKQFVELIESPPKTETKIVKESEHVTESQSPEVVKSFESLSTSKEIETEVESIVETPGSAVDSETIVNLSATAKDEAKDISVVANDCQIISETVKSPESISELSCNVLKQSETSLEQTDILSFPKSQSTENRTTAELDSGTLDDLTSLTESITDVLQIEKGDLVIQSEEGPLPLSEESLVEAKPAVIIPEDDFVCSVLDAVKTIDFQSTPDSPVMQDGVKVVETDEICTVEPITKNAFGKSNAYETDFFETTSAQPIETRSEPIVPQHLDSDEKVVPPSLPESSIPNLEKSESDVELSIEKVEDLLVGVSPSPTQNISFNSIAEPVVCLLPPEKLVDSVSSVPQEIVDNSADFSDILPPAPIENLVVLTDEAFPEPPSCPLPPKEIFDPTDDLPVPPKQLTELTEKIVICSAITKNLSSPAKNVADLMIEPNVYQSACPVVTLSGNPELPKENGTVVNDLADPVTPKSPINDNNITLVGSPTRILNSATLISPKESSQSQIIGDQSNEEFEVESLSQSLNSYNDSEIQLKERLAETKGINGVENTSDCPLLNAAPTALPDKAQSIPEPQVIAEKPTEVETTESVMEAPASPAPPAPVEAPVLPPPEPAITEDVASVTKAIQEIDISEKAVAAAVNEAIDSVNTSDIVNDTHYQSFNEN